MSVYGRRSPFALWPEVRKNRKGLGSNILFKGIATTARRLFISHSFLNVLCTSQAYSMDFGEHIQITTANWRITTMSVHQIDTSGPELILSFHWSIA